MGNFKKAAMWTGIVVTALCGVVLLGGGKVVSGTLLIATAFIMVRPIRRLKLPLWARIGLLCAVYGLVALNISTTDLPLSSNGMVMACGSEAADGFTPTGIKFWDQVRWIFSSFLAQAESS